MLRQGRGREGPDVRRKNWCPPGRCMAAYSLWPCDKLVLANSVQGGIDIGRCVADLDIADDVALLGVSDSEAQANLHRIESSAEAVGLMINVGKTNNMGVKCEKPGASVPIAQKNVEVLTGNHKGRYGTLIETKNQSRLLIGREVLVGKKKNAGWFETLAGEKLRLKSSAEAECYRVN